VRYYWTNIPNVTQPDDLGILLKDVILENTNQLELSHPHIQHVVKKINKYCTVDPHKAGTMTARQYASWNGTYTIESLAKYKVPLDKTLQIFDKEIRKDKIKQSKGKNPADTIYYIHNTEVKPESPQIKEPYLFGVITPDRVNKRQNGQRFSASTKFYTLTAQDKHGILTEGYIRKLTPVECERLQTLPDNYTEGVSEAQRYKMLGNGWTVNVITHIFSGLEVT
jgi:DNA (cytosine-5)-methyltransferase 3A